MCLTDGFFNSQGFGAFLGAFFAFIFGLIAYVYDKKRERIVKHKNAVVELEYLLNEHLDYISRNQFLIRGTIEIFKKKHLTFNQFTLFRLIPDTELKLADLELINQSFTYRTLIERINSDLRSINKAIELVNSRDLTGEALERNLKYFSVQLEKIDKILGMTFEKTKSLMGYLRIYMRNTFNKPTIFFWVNYHKEVLAITSINIKREISALEEEIKSSQLESKKEIEELLRAEIN